MKRKYTIEVWDAHGKTWAFTITGTPEDKQAWDEAGLEVYLLVNSIPGWVVDCGLVRVWGFFQDLFNFNFRSLIRK